MKHEKVDGSVDNGNPAHNERDCFALLRVLDRSQGEIDNSVLVAFGEICTFAGALFGVDYSYKLKINTNSKTQNVYRRRNVL